jgi:hypothetical protein
MAGRMTVRMKISSGTIHRRKRPLRQEVSAI